MRRYSNSLLNLFLISSMLCVLSVSAFARTHRPNLLQPLTAEACLSTNPTFVWQQEAGAIDYVLQVASEVTVTGNNVVFDEEAMIINQVTPTTFLSVNLPENNTKYWWRVVVHFSNGTVDTSANRYAFTKMAAPSNLMPVDLSSCVNSNVTFSWDRPLATTKYRLEVATDTLFTNKVVNQSVSNASSFTWKANNNSTYYWRMRTEEADRCPSEYTAYKTFTTSHNAPIVVTPMNNSFGHETTVQLNWDYPETETVSVESYWLKVSKNADMSNPIVNEEVLADTFFILNSLDLNTNYFWQVRAKINSCSGDWTSVQKFITKYEVSNLLSPVNMMDCVPTNTNFVWKSVPTARAYDLHISTMANFSDTVALVTSINDTTATLDMPNGLTTYFWRIKAADSKNFGDWTLGNSFATTFSAPTLVAPADNVFGHPLNVTFEWNNEFPAEEYIFQLSSTPEFDNADIVLLDTVRAGSISTTLSEYNSAYYWRVAVINAANCNGMWSDIYTVNTVIDAPVLITPMNNATKQTTSIAMTWSEVSGALLYDVELSKDTTFADNKLVFSLYHTSGLNAFVQNLNSNSTYYWRARAKNDDCISRWSHFYSFRTALTIPVLVYPEHNAKKIAVAPELKWEAGEAGTMYKLELSKESNFASKLLTVVDLDTNVFTLDTLDNYTVYYWRVSAYNATETTPWAARSFRVIAPALTEAPVLVAPVDDLQNAERIVVLTWMPIATTEYYHVQVSTKADFSTLVVNADDLTNTAKDFSTLLYNQKYFWRVMAMNEVGNSPWSEVRSFTIKVDPASVEDYATGFKAMAMPNPAKANFDLAIETPTDAIAEVIISDESGKSVKSFSLQLTAGQLNKVGVNSSELNSGVYFITVITPFSKVTEKITVIK